VGTTGSLDHLPDSTIAPEESGPPGLLGPATVVDARTGRKLNNALTLTFKTSPEDTIAVGTQVGSAWVLLGFKNTGDAGRFTVKGPAGELALDCRARQTTVTTAGGEPVGTVERVDDDGELRDAGGSVLARLAGLPKEHSRDPACRYPLSDGTAADLGTLTLLTTAAVGFDLVGELVDTAVFWGKAAPLKVPTLGARLDLHRAVGSTLGNLLLCTCVTIALGPQAFIRRE
jgi:hypothetical protein